MKANARRAWKTYLWLAALALLATGCQHFRIPTFDPTGERLFSTTDSMQLAALSDSRCNPSLPRCLKPAWQEGVTPPPCPEPPPPPPPGAKVHGAPKSAVQPRPVQKGIPGKLMVTPGRLIAPVGSEVVLMGGLCGQDGYLVTGQKVEWNLSQDSAGQFVDFNDRDTFWHSSKKLSADFAITTTSTRNEVLTRGTPSVTDDIVQQKGQCWVSVSSASEGTSYITAVAPEGATWPQRRQSATIYWIDCQWAFPNPVAVPAGQPCPLSTHLTRTATKAPVVGWIIRYEVLDGSAVFAPGNTAAIEVRTDDNGMGAVTLQPVLTQAGVTQVHIEVIRPADPNSDAPRTKMGEGYTSITWSAPGLDIQAFGPASGAIDSVLVYRVEVNNPGDIVTRGVVITHVLPPNLQFVSSNPPARIYGERAQWEIGDLNPKNTLAVEINVRAVAGGAFRYAFRAGSTDGLQKDASVDTQIAEPALRLNVTAPPTAAVGERVQFGIELTNTSNRPVENIRITDRFDAGLEQVDGKRSPLELDIPRLEPNQTQQTGVSFIVRGSGQICHVIEATAPGGQYAQQQVCLTASQAAVASQANMSVTKTGPQEASVGQNVRFVTMVANTGNVPLTNVRVTDAIPAELRPVEASENFDKVAWAAGSLVWVVPRLDIGEAKQFEVLCNCIRPAASVTSRTTVTSDQGKSEFGETSLVILAAGGGATIVPGSPAVPEGQLDLRIVELGDPIRVGEATNYELQISNNRAVSDYNVVLRVELPEGLRLAGFAGPVAGRKVSPDGRTIEVSPIKEIRAGETIRSFQLTATGVQIGDHTLRVSVTSQLSRQGVMMEETTSVTAQ